MKLIIFMMILMISIKGFTVNMDANMNIDADLLQVKIYKISVTASSACTGTKYTVVNDPNPPWTDMAASQSIGTGIVPVDTYGCVIIEMGDIIRFSPASNSYGTNGDGNCQELGTYYLDICQTGLSSPLTSGTTTNCTTVSSPNQDTTPERVALYLSTYSTNTDNSGNCFQPPTLGNQALGVPIDNALTVSLNDNGTVTVSQMLINTSDTICDTADDDCNIGPANTCAMDQPTFDFQQVSN